MPRLMSTGCLRGGGGKGLDISMRHFEQKSRKYENQDGSAEQPRRAQCLLLQLRCYLLATLLRRQLVASLDGRLKLIQNGLQSHGVQ